MDLGQLISDFGFPIVMSVGMGYFIYYLWWYINTHINPALKDMHIALIKVIDQTRMLDQDMIRLQQKVNVVLEYRARQEVLENVEEKDALQKVKGPPRAKK